MSKAAETPDIYKELIKRAPVVLRRVRIERIVGDLKKLGYGDLASLLQMQEEARCGS